MPSCFKANSTCPSRSSDAGAIPGGTASVSPIRSSRVTGCTLAVWRKGKAESRRVSCKQAYPAKLIAQILIFERASQFFFSGPIKS
ncbi:hypothetical protein AN403_5867 [Pseudomonas fluorescens]|uniref:Uncharacterized protein n=1 Tax=Pseudomonas fluorescens TaxID=294 RepID=A0A0P8X6D6_PSEFL|nr:hypothetical protein AN403_5867 [Pseudomonas fluorescens]